jgi:hypothetical protein
MRFRKPREYPWRLKLFIAAFVACIIGYFGFIVSYGVNVVFWDDWAWASFLHRGQTTLGSLWAQHNENIMFFPNALAYFLIRLTAWNTMVFLWISGVLLVGVLAMITRVFWNEIKQAPLVWLPLPFIVLTPAQYQSTLWAFQVAWYMVLLSIVGAIFLLERPNVSTRHVVAAALIGVLGSYSSVHGLLVWPAGLIMLSSKGQSNRLRALWSAFALVTILGFFAAYNVADTNSASPSQILAHMSEILQGLLLTVGSVIPSYRSSGPPIFSSVILEVIGGLLLIAGIAVISSWIRQGRPRGPKAFCVALIATSILFDLLLVPSRLAFDEYYGTASRMNTFMWPLLLGTYAYLVMSRPSELSKWGIFARAPRIAISLVMAAAVVVGTIVGVNQGQISRSVRLTSVDVLANWQDAPPAVSAPYLFPPCGFNRQHCVRLRIDEQLLASRHMSVFSQSAATLERLRAGGVVPGGVAARPLVVPAALRAEVGSSYDSRRAWSVLSTVYRSNPYLERLYPSTDSGKRALLMWAIRLGGGVTAQSIRQSAWEPPVSTWFFLHQYVPVYKTWISKKARHRVTST